jgi:hypothetical protein
VLGVNAYSRYIIIQAARVCSGLPSVYGYASVYAVMRMYSRVD